MNMNCWIKRKRSEPSKQGNWPRKILKIDKNLGNHCARKKKYDVKNRIN